MHANHRQTKGVSWHLAARYRVSAGYDARGVGVFTIRYRMVMILIAVVLRYPRKTAARVAAFALLGSVSLFAQATPATSGRVLYENRCARCHGADGKGGERGPAITTRIGSHNDQEIAALVRTGLPGRGMPPNQVSAGRDAGAHAFPENAAAGAGGAADRARDGESRQWHDAQRRGSEPRLRRSAIADR